MKRGAKLDRLHHVKIPRISETYIPEKITGWSYQELQTPESTSLSVLPDEVLNIVLAHLASDDRRSLAEASAHFRSVVFGYALRPSLVLPEFNLKHFVSFVNTRFTHPQCVIKLSLRTKRESIKHLKELKTLRNGFCLNLKNSEHLFDLSVLSEFTSTRELNLYGCRNVNDITALKYLTNLQELKLSFCGMAEFWEPPEPMPVPDLAPIKTLYQLRSLSISATHISDLSALTGLQHLRELYMNFCHNVTDLSPLSELTQLRTLDLSECFEVVDLSPLTGLSQLQSLDIRGCRLVTSLLPLSNIGQLRTVRLSNVSDLSLSPLSNLTQLCDLTLVDSRRRVCDIQGWSGLKHLTELSLVGCDVYGLQLPSGITKLEIVACDGFDQSLMVNLRQLSALALDFSQNIDIKQIGIHTHLQNLSLRGCGVTDITPLVNLKQLQCLNLISCYVSDLSPLSKLNRLRSLELSDDYQLVPPGPYWNRQEDKWGFHRGTWKKIVPENELTRK